MSKYVIAIGGNALAENAAKLDNILKNIAGVIANLYKWGNQVVLVHGNGPQIGNIVIQNEFTKKIIPESPMDECVAMTQALIGYPLQQHIYNELQESDTFIQPVTLITQVLVDEHDLQGLRATKPIGPYYTEEEARELAEENHIVMGEEAGKGYRRLVVSPEPRAVVEMDLIKELLASNRVVITGGGGGVPVIRKDGRLYGVDAVIDKDLTAERIAEEVDADFLVILTGAEYLALNYGKKDQRNLKRVSITEINQYIEQNQFPEGSMLPKVLAARRFVDSGNNRCALIGTLEKLQDILERTSGTKIEGRRSFC